MSLHLVLSSTRIQTQGFLNAARILLMVLFVYCYLTCRYVSYFLCVCTYVHVGVCRHQRLTLNVFLIHFLLLHLVFKRKDFTLNLVVWKAPVILQFLPPQCWDYRLGPLCWLACMFCGFELRPSS